MLKRDERRSGSAQFIKRATLDFVATGWTKAERNTPRWSLAAVPALAWSPPWL